MMNIKKIVPFFVLLSSAVLFAACGGSAPAPPVRARTEASPTPEYKPPKRVSRDVIRDEKTVPVKAKAE